MNRALIIGSLVTVLGAGGVIVGTMGDKGGLEELDGGAAEPLDGEEAQAVELPNPHERDVVQAIYGARNNKPMRLVGVQAAQDAQVVDSEVGRVTEVASVPADARCVAIFEAPVKNGSNPPVPNMPAFGDFEGREMRPVQIPESNQGVNWVWYTMLVGPDCQAMADNGQFLGSDLQSVLKLPAPMQRRILRAEVQCEPEGPGTCMVPLDDPRVTAESLVFLPVQLAGRPDLNFVSKRGGQVESRMEEPEGGWTTAVAHPR